MSKIAGSDNRPESTPVCLITGGSSGVGLATALKFAAKGYHVAICAKNTDRLMQAHEQVRAACDGTESLAITADLNQPQTCTPLVEQVERHWGRLDVLVNNAAVAPLANVDETSDDVFEQAVNVNIRSVFYLTRRVWTIMKRQQHGTIVNMSSLAAVDPFPGFSTYGASKAWIDLFTVALGNEGRALGIKAFSIRAGAIETPMLRCLFPEFPIEQAIQPQRVADVICALIECEFEPASGQSIVVKA